MNKPKDYYADKVRLEAKADRIKRSGYRRPYHSSPNIAHFFGIDPGKSGAISLLDSEGTVVDEFRLSERPIDINNWIVFHLDSVRHAALEKVHSFPSQGVSSTFAFGQSFGFLKGLLIAHRVPFFLVLPRMWQKELDCMTGGDKNVTKAKAAELWPDRKWYHWNSDAALIGKYCREHFYQQTKVQHAREDIR